MQEIDDDATVTQLAQSWINIAMGGEKYNDAYYIYQELIDKFRTKTVLLLNGQVTCLVGMGKITEAQELLQEAIEKDPSDYDTLVNLIYVTQIANGKGDVINRYLSQLKNIPNDNIKDLLNDRKRWELELNRICLNYQPLNTSLASD